MRLITCHIGCISPRRQARKRRTLQTSKTYFVQTDLIPMEGTNAKWCHAKSAAYVRDAKPEGDVHSNLPKQRSPLENNGFLSIKFSLSGGSKYKVLETRLRWRGRMRLEPCQIGSIRPRRQALERRTLHPTRPTVPSGKQWFQSSNNWFSRFVSLHTCRWRGQMQK